MPATVAVTVVEVPYTRVEAVALSFVVVEATVPAVPVSATVCVAPVAFSALSVMVSIPVTAPVAVLAGLKMMLRVQLAPGATVKLVEQAVDAVVCNVNPAETLMPLSVNAVLPVFSNVMT